MLVDITEEERIFLERMCSRAEIFAIKGIAHRPMERDLDAIRSLKNKFKELDQKDS